MSYHYSGDSYTIPQELKKSRERKLMAEVSKSRNFGGMLEKTNKELMHYKDLYIRQRAEMENYIKAKDREVQSIIKNANKDLIRNILPAIDSMDSAILSGKDPEVVNPLKDQALKILSMYGLKPIEAKGKKFDPYLHEVVAVADNGEDGTVIEEVQKGYTLNGEVVRSSKVIVSKR